MQRDDLSAEAARTRVEKGHDGDTQGAIRQGLVGSENKQGAEPFSGRAGIHPLSLPFEKIRQGRCQVTNGPSQQSLRVFDKAVCQKSRSVITGQADAIDP